MYTDIFEDYYYIDALATLFYVTIRPLPPLLKNSGVLEFLKI